MQVARDEPELQRALRACADRARASFGKDAVYLERYFEKPRHVEVQILGDGHLTLAVGARECSIQRRHQKILEEAPPPAFELPEPRPRVLRKLLDAGLKAARAVGYGNAGTCEFLLVGDEVYFIELNARLQVEHPVTEATTGLDLVREQLRIAAGEPMGVEKIALAPRGAAIECRLYAEDPDNNFSPSPGRIRLLRFGSGPGVRVDSGVESGDEVAVHYDPLIAKIVAWGSDRAQ